MEGSEGLLLDSRTLPDPIAAATLPVAAKVAEGDLVAEGAEIPLSYDE